MIVSLKKIQKNYGYIYNINNNNQNNNYRSKLYEG